MTKRDRNYLLVFLGVTLLFVAYMFTQKTGVKAYQIVANKKLSVDTIPAGTYSGHFRAYNITFAEVQFSSDSGRIENFTIRSLLKAPWIDVEQAITDSIEQQNKLEFDAISGATSTSLYVKAAIYNAISDTGKTPTISNK